MEPSASTSADPSPRKRYGVVRLAHAVWELFLLNLKVAALGLAAVALLIFAAVLMISVF